MQAGPRCVLFRLVPRSGQGVSIRPYSRRVRPDSEKERAGEKALDPEEEVQLERLDRRGEGSRAGGFLVVQGPS